MSNKAAQNMFLEAAKRATEEARKPGNDVSREVASDRKKEEKITQKSTYKSAQISKGLSNPLSKSISTDDVELLDFELRKIRKFRVNADIPEDWKEELDSLAFRLKVGKYELLTFVIGQFLGKVKRKDQL